MITRLRLMQRAAADGKLFVYKDPSIKWRSSAPDWVAAKFKGNNLITVAADLGHTPLEAIQRCNKLLEELCNQTK